LKSPKVSRPAPDKRLTEIWRLVRQIPRGCVVTYGDIARALRPPCNPRLIGRALGKAPPGLSLPWHRVLAAGGRIALPGEYGLDQRMRLQTEGVTFSGKRVRMKQHQWKPGRKESAREKQRRRPC
jgi:methylated-DNA-protein-cysteine methyltransferase-like protein